MDKNKNAVELFNKYAFDYQLKFMDVGLYADCFDFFCSQLELENASVLELACGPGNITKYLLDKRPDLKILATDLSHNMIELAKNNNPKAEFMIMDCRDIYQIDNKYDAIMCGFCLPYLDKDETIKLIGDATKLLNSEGIIFISTMEDKYSNSRIQKGSQGDEIFMHYYEADYLIEIMNIHALNVIYIDRKYSIATDNSKNTDLILIAKKN